MAEGWFHAICERVGIYSADRCFPAGAAYSLGITDSAAAEGNDDEILSVFVRVRDDSEAKLRAQAVEL